LVERGQAAAHEINALWCLCQFVKNTYAVYVIFSYTSGQNLPFALQHEPPHIALKTTPQQSTTTLRRTVMSWIFDAYANVYGAALFGGLNPRGNVARAKSEAAAEGARTASYLASFR
jgi:hypothetical protein